LNNATRFVAEHSELNEMIAMPTEPSRHVFYYEMSDYILRKQQPSFR